MNAKLPTPEQINNAIAELDVDNDYDWLATVGKYVNKATEKPLTQAELREFAEAGRNVRFSSERLAELITLLTKHKRAKASAPADPQAKAREMDQQRAAKEKELAALEAKKLQLQGEINTLHYGAQNILNAANELERFEANHPYLFGVESFDLGNVLPHRRQPRVFASNPEPRIIPVGPNVPPAKIRTTDSSGKEVFTKVGL